MEIDHAVSQIPDPGETVYVLPGMVGTSFEGSDNTFLQILEFNLSDSLGLYFKEETPAGDAPVEALFHVNTRRLGEVLRSLSEPWMPEDISECRQYVQPGKSVPSLPLHSQPHVPEFERFAAAPVHKQYHPGGYQWTVDLAHKQPNPVREVDGTLPMGIGHANRYTTLQSDLRDELREKRNRLRQVRSEIRRGEKEKEALYELLHVL